MRAISQHGRTRLGLTASALCACVWVLTGAYLIWGATERPESPASSTPGIAILSRAGHQPLTRSSDRAKAIQEIVLGERVLGTNPLIEQAEGVDPDPATWRKISLHLRKENGLSHWIELLRPLAWIEANMVDSGRTVFINMPDMGAVGEAEVTFLGPCPPIRPGKGSVVTGRFTHQADSSRKVLWVRLEGQQEATGVTENHPYWSEDRKEFVDVGRLRIGELVNTEFGPRRVESITPISGYNGLLYNLETTEHVYRVGSLGTLVHNACLVQPYGGPGGGHHIFAKKAFEGVVGYSESAALAIPQSEMTRLGLNHLGSGGITQTQRALFSELAASGRPNTLAEHTRIAVESLVAGGLSRRTAVSVVKKALDQLSSWGITGPSGIPWN